MVGMGNKSLTVVYSGRVESGRGKDFALTFIVLFCFLTTEIMSKFNFLFWLLLFKKIFLLYPRKAHCWGVGGVVSLGVGILSDQGGAELRAEEVKET